MKVWLLIAAASLLLAGCANPATSTPTKTTTVAAAAGGTETVVWPPVSGCNNHTPYLDLPTAQTGITYLVNGQPATQTGQLFTAAGRYTVTIAAGTGVTPSLTGPWSFTLAAC